MEFFRKKTNIDFMELRRWSAILSILLCLGSVVSLAVNGLAWGLDFTGGMQIEVGYDKPADLPSMRQQLASAGFHQAEVKNYGTEEVLISVAPRAGVAQQKVSEEIIKALPGAQLRRVEYVGAQVGQELAAKGALAVIVALLATMSYIALRFEYRFAVSAAVALVHDPILILGLFSFFQIEFNLTALAAVLAVLGYSLNDTIVIFDRIRENFRKLRKGTPIEIVNLSINETLSRTIMTSATTLSVVSALYFFGGEMIHGFALALIIGIVVGTYSSIYVAGALAVALGLSKKDLMPVIRKELDDRP